MKTDSKMCPVHPDCATLLSSRLLKNRRDKRPQNQLLVSRSCRWCRRLVQLTADKISVQSEIKRDYGATVWSRTSLRQMATVDPSALSRQTQANWFLIKIDSIQCHSVQHARCARSGPIAAGTHNPSTF